MHCFLNTYTECTSQIYGVKRNLFSSIYPFRFLVHIKFQGVKNMGENKYASHWANVAKQ